MADSAKEPASSGALPSWRSVLGEVFRDRGYRSILIELFLMALAEGMVMPYLTLWVTEGLHGTTAQAAFLFVPSGLVAIVAAIASGAYTDHVLRRKGAILLGLVCAGVSFGGLGLTSSYGVALALFAISGLSPFATVFALLNDTIRSKTKLGEEHPESGAFITTLQRTAYSFGWLVGPVVGGLLVERIGYRGIFFVSGGLFFVGALWAWRKLEDRAHERTQKRAVSRKLRLPEVGLLALLFLVGLLLFAGDSGRIMFLPLYLTERLHASPSVVSLAFSLTVLGELLFLPIAGRIADRVGVVGVLSTGIAVQALFFFGLGASGAYWEILLLQIPYAFVVAASSGVAVVFAQGAMSGERTGLTTSSYLVSFGLAPLVNILLLELGNGAGKLNRLFDALGLSACAALVLVLLISRTRRPTIERPG